MKPKNTIVLVIIAHIGLFLIWMCMGGCSLNRGGTTVEEIRPSDVTIPGPEDERISLDTTETVTEEVVVRETDIDRPTVIREERKRSSNMLSKAATASGKSAGSSKSVKPR